MSEEVSDGLLVNCNDLFFWGLADAEQVTNDNMDIYLQAHKECPKYGDELFCCRVRGMRPQGVFYKSLNDGEKQLFDACGPARETGFGNPYSQEE